MSVHQQDVEAGPAAGAREEPPSRDRARVRVTAGQEEKLLRICQAAGLAVAVSQEEKTWHTPTPGGQVRL